MTFLLIDVGAGTLDVLWYDSATGEHYKAVAPSPVRQIARQIEETTGPLAVDGVEMGGGAVAQVLRTRARSADVVISPAAAATINHDPERVRGAGLRIENSEVVRRLANDPAYTAVTLADIQPERLFQLLAGVGVALPCDVVAVCAQDHGVAPPGVSHLDFRHNQFVPLLEETHSPHGLLFRSDEIPAAFNRLRSMAGRAAVLGAQEVYVMDSGMAAILGASQDVQLRGKGPVLVLDIATSHTVAAAVDGGELAGFVEYHTAALTLPKLEGLLRALPDGDVDHASVLTEGGHGAYLHRAVGFGRIQAILATGPKRRLVATSALPISWGAPWGDNMMTGTVGLLEAVRRRKGLDPIEYL